MPVLTYELTFGTKTLHYLNISHNLISEIRKSVLGNLTSLRVMDLSHNLIEDLTAANVFILPENLSYLSLAYNSLHSFSLKHITKTNSLEHFDLSFNQLESFFNDLMPMIKKGTHIYYEGNPVSCDCLLRPVRRWVLSLSVPEDAWSQFHCQDVLNFTDTPLTELPEEFLVCNTTNEEESEEYQLTPDVKFRQVQLMKDGGVITTWFVNTKTDIADFRMIVRKREINITNRNEETLWERLEPYNVRSDKFFSLPKNQDGLELCIEAVTSEGKSKPSIQSQCQELPYLNSASYSHLSQLLLFICALFLL